MIYNFASYLIWPIWQLTKFNIGFLGINVATQPYHSLPYKMAHALISLTAVTSLTLLELAMMAGILFHGTILAKSGYGKPN